MRSMGFAGAFVLLAACGGPPDTGEVSLTIVRSNVAPNTLVAFHDADGALLGVGETDENGRVTGQIERGGMITAQVSYFGRAHLRTVVGVEPGDEIEWIESTPAPGVVGDVEVVLPGSLPGASGYVVLTSCDPIYGTDAELGTPLTLPILASCLEQGPLDITAIAVNAAGTTLAASSVLGEAGDLPSSVTLPAWSTSRVDTSIEARDVVGRAALNSACMMGSTFPSSTADNLEAVDGAVAMPAEGLAACDRLQVRFSQYTTAGGPFETYLDFFEDLGPITITADERIAAVDAIERDPDPEGSSVLLHIDLASEGTRPNKASAYLIDEATGDSWVFLLPGERTTVPLPALPQDMEAEMPPLDAHMEVTFTRCSASTWDELRQGEDPLADTAGLCRDRFAANQQRNVDVP